MSAVADLVAFDYVEMAVRLSFLLYLLKALDEIICKFSNKFRGVTRRRDPSLVLDTGAAVHGIFDRTMFSTYECFPTNKRKIVTANGTTSNAHGRGNVILKMTSSGLNLTLKNVWYVPDIRRNLISGPELCKDFIRLEFDYGKAVLLKSGQIIGDGYLDKGQFLLNATVVKP